MATKKLHLPRFEIDRKKSKTGKYHYWGRFIAKNGKEIWRTSEVYARPLSVVNAIDVLRRPITIPIYKIWDK